MATAGIMVKSTPATAADVFDARPSQRLGNHHTIEADGDTWQELLAVCEPSSGNDDNDAAGNKSGRKGTVPQTKKGTKGSSPSKSASATTAPPSNGLVIRSYFENKRSGKRVWDEPPSGASNVIPATDEMRKMAALQLNELHVVTGAVEGLDSSSSHGSNSHGSNHDGGNDGDRGASNKSKNKSLGSRLAGVFRRGRDGKNSNTDNKKKQQRKVEYKPGSKLKAMSAGTKIPSRRSGGRGGSTDPQLQEAIARSIAESQGIPYSATGITSTMTTSIDYEDDEDMAMAKALSLSAAPEAGFAASRTSATAVAATAGGQAPWGNESEEEVLRRVLEASKLETKNTTPWEHRQNNISLVAPSPSQDYRPMLNLKMAPSQNSLAQDNSDRKLPAVPTTPPHAYSRASATSAAAPASPQTPDVGKFDPYSTAHVPSPNSYKEQEKRRQHLASLSPPRKLDDNPQRPASPIGAAAVVARRALRRPSPPKKLKDKAGLV